MYILMGFLRLRDETLHTIKNNPQKLGGRQEESKYRYI